MIFDVTGMELVPGNHGIDCPGNDMYYDAVNNPDACCCNECDYYLCCITKDYQKMCQSCDEYDCPRKEQSEHNKIHLTGTDVRDDVAFQIIKLIDKMKNKSTAIKPEEVQCVLDTFGYRLKRQKGSYIYFINDDGDVITIRNQIPLKAVYVKDVLIRISKQ